MNADLFDKYTKVPPRVRISLGVVIYALVIVAYYLLVHAPELQKVRDLNGELAKLQALRAEKAAYVENLPLYEKRFTELQESLRMARAMLPDDAAVPEFLA